MGDIFIKDNDGNEGLYFEIEKDMVAVRAKEEDSFSAKIFKQLPLVGDYDLSPKAFETLYQTTQKVITTLLRDRENRTSGRHLSLKLHEQITLVVIHFAKTWNSSEESKFTKYLAAQFGYRDENGRIWDIVFKPSIETAFKSNNRFFLIRNGERQYYETIMVHSMGPDKSWFALYDLLFDFYVNNLDMQCVINDPLFHTLVKALQFYFSEDIPEENELKIATGSYRIRLGVRRLVQERPGYSVVLFEQIVKRIDALVNNIPVKSERHNVKMLDEWYANRVGATKEWRAPRKQSTRSVDLATDYTKINIRYSYNMGEVLLNVPSIRLSYYKDGFAYADLYDGDRLVETISLSVFGNELGETIRGFAAKINSALTSSESIELRIVIRKENEIIYDSKQKLFRSIIAFSDEREISINNITRGSYVLFMADIDKLKVQNADIISIGNNAVEVILHKNFTVSYSGNIIAEDYDNSNEIKIISPEIYENVRYEKEGDSFSVLKKQSSLKIYFGNESATRKYKIFVGGRVYSLDDFCSVGESCRAVVPMSKFGTGIFSLKIVDILLNRTIFRGDYYREDNLRFLFNKEKYYSEADYNDFLFTLELGSEKVLIQETDNRREIAVPLSDGILFFEIPGFSFDLSGIKEIRFKNYLFVDDIQDEDHIILFNNCGSKLTLKCNDITIDNPSTFYLSQIKQWDLSNNARIVKLIAVFDQGEVELLNIVLNGYFVKNPILSFNDNTLCWDGGTSFIGKMNSDLVLKMRSESEEDTEYSICIGQNVIAIHDEMSFQDGQYLWAIYEGNDCTPIAMGQTFLGDAKKIRFINKRIRIENVTEDVDNSITSVSIKPVLVDHIKYISSEFIPTEGGVYDVYSGEMYWMSMTGKRVYSYKYDNRKYKVNPIKIIYINDKFLRIVNEDDEGIFCFYNNCSSEPGYEITDIEPGKNSLGYKDILFYIYSLEEKEKRAIERKQKEEARLTEVSEEKPVATVGKKKRIIYIASSDDSNGENNKDTSKQPDNSKNVEETTVCEAPNECASEDIGLLGKDLMHCQTVEQKVVIESAATARIFVNAGPGTGKTWTLIEKIIYLVECLEVEPERIQILCFSRAAVEVIQNRLKDAILQERASINIGKVDIRSFDSFASQLLYFFRDNDEDDEIPKDFKIESLSYDARIDAFTHYISRNPEWISQCDHMIVDEVQDLVGPRANMITTMVRALPEECGITLMGDVCQAIYDYQVSEKGWNSARFLLEIEKENTFKYYSFNRNHRQVERLIAYGDSFRQTILQGVASECNIMAKELSTIIPYINLVDYALCGKAPFNHEDTSGSVGILTRTNAEALHIDTVLRKNKIEHALKRRTDNNLHHFWISYFFNSCSREMFSFEDFADEFNAICLPIIKSDVDLLSIWNEIEDYRFGTTGKISAREMIIALFRRGRNRDIFLCEKKSPIVISTIHGSKGKEFDSVIVSDKLLCNDESEIDEHRVKYVALTRAKHSFFTADFGETYSRNIGSNSRACETKYNSNGKYLSRIEVGITGYQGDFNLRSFCNIEGLQNYIREVNIGLINEEVYLEKMPVSQDGYVIYSAKLKKNGLIIGQTSQAFAQELSDAIKEIKGIWSHQIIQSEHLYPPSFTGLYISDISSEMGLAQGDEEGVTTKEDVVVWNTLIIEGYAKAEYKKETVNG